MESNNPGNPNLQQTNLAQTPQPVVQPPIIVPVQQQPITPVSNYAPKKGNNGKLVVAILVVLVIVGLTLGGYLYLTKYPKKTYNATVYNQPVVKSTPIPQPTSVPTINPNDSTNQALGQDSQILNQNLNGVNSDLNSLDQSFNDQQTNLQ